MYTQQVQQLNALRGKLPDAAIDALLSVVGQCANALEHRGPITIDVHPERLRDAPCHTITEGDVAAALTVKAYGGEYTRDPDQVGEGRICGPVAIYTEGPIYARPNEDGFSFVGKCADLECVYADNGDFHDIDVDNLTVNNNLNAKTARWAVCQSNWEYGANYPSKGGGMAWVSVKQCLDSAGTGPSGVAFDVRLPISAGQDPNLTQGQVVLIQKSGDGWACESSGDDAIGSVKYWSGNDAPGAKDEILPGWRAVKRVPGTPDPTRSLTTWSLHPDYILTWPVATDQVAHLFEHAGTEVHTHDPHTPGDAQGGFIADHQIGAYTDVAYTGITVDPHDGFYTQSAYTGITVDDHDDHFHDFTLQEEGQAAVSGILAGVSPLLGPDTGGALDSDGNPLALSHTIQDSQHSHFVDDYLYHYVNDPGHKHYFSYVLEHDFNLPHSTESHLPPYVALWLIERVDNGTGGGVFAGGGP